MRELKKDELKAVSGGTFWLLGGLLRCLFPVKTTTVCAPSQPVKPQPKC
ncbi:MAG: hypothetical protein QG612_1998 [Pseudomonadota bacterium]|nr:hypothetical protein [Pseudomonadota bacterium]